MRGPCVQNDQRPSGDQANAAEQSTQKPVISELEWFVIHQNIDHLSKVALEARDPVALSMVLKLLGEERSKLTRFNSSEVTPNPSSIESA